MKGIFKKLFKKKSCQQLLLKEQTRVYVVFLSFDQKTIFFSEGEYVIVGVYSSCEKANAVREMLLEKEKGQLQEVFISRVILDYASPL